MRQVVWVALGVFATLSGCAEEPLTFDTDPSVGTTPQGDLVLLGSYEFSGTTPVELPSTPTFTISNRFLVEENVVRLNVTMENDYVGAGPTLLTIRDPQGSEKANSYDDCDLSFLDSPAICTMTVEPYTAGTWDARLEWQAGQGTDSYRIVIDLYGVA